MPQKIFFSAYAFPQPSLMMMSGVVFSYDNATCLSVNKSDCVLYHSNIPLRPDALIMEQPKRK